MITKHPRWLALCKKIGWQHERWRNVLRVNDSKEAKIPLCWYDGTMVEMPIQEYIKTWLAGKDHAPTGELKPL